MPALRCAAAVTFVTLVAAAIEAGDSSDSKDFDCRARGLAEQRVPWSLVRDGVCDCCNGRDEDVGATRGEDGDDVDGAPVTTCADTCADVIGARARSLRALIAAHERGARAAARAMPNSTRAQRFARESRAARDAAVAAYDAAAGDERRAARRASPARAEELRVAVRQAAVAAVTADALAASDFGPHARLLPLALGPCAASPPVSEKSSKGGSTTSTPKRYAWGVCGFGCAVQVEVGPAEWRVHDATDRGEAAAANVAVSADGGVDDAPRDLGVPTWLGAFRGYVPHADVDAALYVGQIAGDDAATVARLVRPGAPLPAPPAPARALPAGADVGDVAAVYSAGGGLGGRCWTGGMSADRRAFAFHVCPGLSPADVQLGAELLGRPVPRRFTRAAAWNAGDGAPVPVSPIAEAVPRDAAGAPDAAAPRVVGVDEDGFCTALLYVATPLACSRALPALARAALAALASA